jgi:hypothetical protein
MDAEANMSTETLLESYEEYLTRKVRVNRGAARHYVAWARQFVGMTGASGQSLSHKALPRFLAGLRSSGVHDWEVSEASLAVRMYLTNVVPGPMDAAPSDNGRNALDPGEDAECLTREEWLRRFSRPMRAIVPLGASFQSA